ncbi:hypothetical protein EAO68_38345 [Streptomyces sp. wa22]|nr:hypothetical protein EAO68_38345 [Streptomyces sp. wa22]
MTTRCPFSDPQDPVSRVSNIRGQGPTAFSAPMSRLSSISCRALFGPPSCAPLVPRVAGR